MSYIVVTTGWFIDLAGRISKNRGQRIRKSRNIQLKQYEAAAFNQFNPQIYPYNSFDLKRTCLFAAVNHEVFPGNPFDSESLWEKNISRSRFWDWKSFFDLQKKWSQWNDHVVNRDPGLKIISKLLASKTEMHPKVFFYCFFFSWTGHHLNFPGKLAIFVSSLYTWSTS